MDWNDWFNVSITRKQSKFFANKIDTDLAQIYEVPNLFTEKECQFVINTIDHFLIPSEVTYGNSNYRTSRTCHLPDVNPELVSILDQYLSLVLGVYQEYSEPIQGQRYDPGQYFKEHNDWFDPDTEEYIEHCEIGGQRTWTVMVYLNDVQEGGETYFPLLGHTFKPERGKALMWNNLYADGTPNEDVLHEALPVIKGRKYIITKWYREKPGLCSIDD